MGRINELFFALNRGEISPLLLARTDLEHLRLAAQTQVNWLPRVLGPASFRPGSEYIGTIYNSAQAKIVPFIAAFNDTAIIELTNDLMRVWVNDALITRVAVGTTVQPFSDTGAWTLVETGTAIISVGAGGLDISNLNQGAYATATQTVTVANADLTKVHALRVVVADGPVILRIGSTSGGNDIFSDETLDTGTYSMAFTPGYATIYIQFSSTVAPENFNTTSLTQIQGYQQTTITSVALEAAGTFSIPTPWPASLFVPPASIRFTQSADVVYVAAPGIPQYQINRYSKQSWSIVLYKPVKGPMNAVVGNNSIILNSSQVSGNGTLNSNQPLFSTSDVGTLFRLFHNGQNISQTLSFSQTYTDCIRVTGVSQTSTYVDGVVVDTPCSDRNFTYQVTGTWTGTITLWRSFEGPNTGFAPFLAFNANTGPTLFTDYLDNEIVWYRWGFGEGNLSSGSAVGTLTYAGGGGYGVCHVTSFVSNTQVDIEILVQFSNTGFAADWHQSEWSLDAGFPTSTALHEGRLWWAGSDRWWGSTSDDYTNFDYDAIGDASYIDTDVGQGPIANINWLLSLDNLLGGADTSVITARSDAIQSPLTPTNFNLRFSTTTGSTGVQAVKIDNRAIYIDQSTRKLFEATYDLYTYNYRAAELSNLNPDIGFAGYVGMAIQRNPDTRILLVRSDGQIVSFIYDVQDDVKAFWRIYTPNGIYEDVIVLPGVIEDIVYVIVNRGGTRYLERFARIDECTGGLMNKNVDCHLAYTGALTTNITASWLANLTCPCWADGVDVGPVTFNAAGVATLTTAAANICVGLSYSAQFVSTKLAYAAQGGTAINQIKRVDHVGFVLQNTHSQGLQYGSYHFPPLVGAGNQPTSASSGLWDQLSPIDSMPLVEQGIEVPTNAVWAYYDQIQMEFPGDTGVDARIFFQATSPRPATVLGLTIGIETSN